MSTKFNPHQWINNTHAEQSSPAAPATSYSNNDPYDDIEIITTRIESARIDITSGYAAWRDLGFALSDALGENGRTYYQRISRFHPEYSAEETDKQYDKCLRAHGTGVTIKTFFQLAKEHGISISIPSKTSNTSNTSFRRNDGSSSASAPLSTNEVCEEIEVIEGQDEIDEELPTFSQRIADNLPDLLKKVVKKSDSAEDSDILLLGSLTVLSVAIPNVTGIYNKRPVNANLFLFVTARASSGKGRLTLCRYLIEPIHERLREINEAEMMEYKEQMQRYNAAGKNKANMEKPEEPPLRMLFIPANSSATAVYQVLNENDGQGIMFETEGDTQAKTIASDYGNYSDGFRKAFHHESISYIRRKDKEYVNLKRPRLSALLTGTPKQISSLITDAENGLFSRFIFYFLNTRIIWQDVFDATDDCTLDEYFQDLGHQFYDFYITLKDYGNIRFSFSADQQKRFNEFFGKAQDEYANQQGTDIVASVRRMGLITFRIAMVLSVLRIMENGCFDNTLLCMDVDFETALTMAEVLLQHTGKVFRELPKVASTPSGSGQKTVRRQLFLDKLPSEFERREFIEIAASLGIPQSTAERNVKKWCDDGWLSQLEQGKYRKN